MQRSITLAISALLFAAAPARAAAPLDDAQQESNAVAEVQVDGMRHPELKPYRVMSAALDAFDEHRPSLAPNAVLKFQLWQRDAAIGEPAKWDGVTLRVAGDELSIPLPIAADGTFTLPRSKAAYDENADLVVNRKKSTITFQTTVNTPGLPAHVRRMGDLRLECEAQIAIGKKELSFAQRAFFNTAFLGGDWCNARLAKFSLVLDDWPISATLDDRGTHKALPVNGYRFLTPLQDKSISNEALISFEYWSKAGDARKREFLANTPLVLKSSVNKWREGPVLRVVDQGRYAARIVVPAGPSSLRLESTNGELALGGAMKDTNVELGREQALRYHGGRLHIDVAQPGTYEISLDLRDPDRPAATITRAAS